MQKEGRSARVAIVILNYNTRKHLERFLPSICATDYFPLEIWVADNGSADSSLQWLKDHYPQIHLLGFDQNYGYAGGYNKALEQINSDYYVLLNSDVEVDQNWLKPLVELAESNTNIAAVQPKILDYKNRKFFEYAGASGGFLDRWGYAFCRGRLFNHLEEDKGQYDQSVPVFWASGACLFIRAEAFQKVGGFDPEFFAHMEEIDLCWRLQAIGYTHYIEPTSVVYHLGGGTLATGSDRKYFLNYRNNLAILVKNHSSSLWMLVLFWRMVLDGISALFFVMKGKPKLLWIIIKAHFAFWFGFRGWISKRRETQKRRMQRVAFYNKSVVWAYFIKGIRHYSDL